MMKLLTLARMTALDSMRQPVCLLLALSGLVMTAAVPMLAMHNFGEDGKLARDAGLAFHMGIGTLVACYSAGYALSKERSGRTLSTVLSKPVGRGTLFLAKFLGVAFVVILFSCMMTVTTLLAERVSQRFITVGEHGAHGFVRDMRTGWLLMLVPLMGLGVGGFLNWKQNRPFGAMAFMTLLVTVCVVFVLSGFYDLRGAFRGYRLIADWRLPAAHMLLTMALLMLAAIALALATRLPLGITGVLTLLTLLAGLLGEHYLAPAPERTFVEQALFGLLPNWRHFWLADALIGGGWIPSAYLAAAGAYSLLYGGGVLCLGLWSFAAADTE